MGSISDDGAVTFATVRSRPSKTAFRKRHSTTGWMAVHFSLMNACTRMSSSSALRLTAMEKSGRTSSITRRLQRAEIAGPGRREGERADRGVLVVERRDHEAPDAVVQHVLLDGRPVRIGGEVLDEQRLALERGALVHRAVVVGQRAVHGVREDGMRVRTMPPSSARGRDRPRWRPGRGEGRAGAGASGAASGACRSARWRRSTPCRSGRA